MNKTLTLYEQETHVTRNREQKNVVEVSTTDTRVINNILKHYESSITRKVYNKSYRGFGGDGLIEVFCTINVKEFKGSLFFPRFQGEDEESK